MRPWAQWTAKAALVAGFTATIAGLPGVALAAAGDGNPSGSVSVLNSNQIGLPVSIPATPKCQLTCTSLVIPLNPAMRRSPAENTNWPNNRVTGFRAGFYRRLAYLMGGFKSDFCNLR